MMDQVEIPEYFICPISLQIMKDPVTAVTGITYDRESIERWLFTSNNTTCPVTKQTLPLDSDLTPNHTLRRLIQAWCTQHASLGVDRIPTPKPPLDKFQVLKILSHLRSSHLYLKALRHLELLAAENERNRKFLVEAGVPKAMVFFIFDCFKKRQIREGLEEALSLLQFVKIPPEEIKLLLQQNDQVLDSLTWVLGFEIVDNSVTLKSHAITVLKNIVQKASSGVMERLKPEFFETIVKVLRNGISLQGMNAGLKVLLAACPWGRNRELMVKSGAVHELIEIELGMPEKRTTELILEIQFHLCSCANGRAQFASHRGGIAVLTERILKVSPAADERAIFVLSLVSKSSALQVIIQEMVQLGTLSKLCMLLQADHPSYLKEKAMEILKSHTEADHHSQLKDKAVEILKSLSEVWKNSP